MIEVKTRMVCRSKAVIYFYSLLNLKPEVLLKECIPIFHSNQCVFLVESVNDTNIGWEQQGR